MGELLGEMILEFFGRLVLHIISELFILLSSITLDGPLKLMGIKITWGFCYEKHRFLSILNVITLILIPIHIYNFGLSNGLFIYLGIFLFIIVVLYFRNVNFAANKEPSNLLDDDFIDKTRP